MAVALPRSVAKIGTPPRTFLIGLALLRAALGAAAVVVAPLLWKDHFTLVTLMRPTKEVLLASGFKVRLGEIGLLPVVAAFVPLGLFGVWLFYLLGRAYADELGGGKGLPRWSKRVLPPKRVAEMCSLLNRRGALVVVLGRLAVFPSTMMAAAAGASDMSMRTFLLADAIGAALSTAMALGVGYALGQAYEDGSRWLTAVGVLVTMALLAAVGVLLRRDHSRTK